MLATLYGMAEAADFLNLNRSTLTRMRKAGKGPEPLQVLKCGPIWSEAQLKAYKQEEEEKEMTKYQNCIAAGVNVSYGKGWDMSAIWTANRTLSLSDLQKLFKLNDWVEYYHGICKNPRF